MDWTAVCAPVMLMDWALTAFGWPCSNSRWTLLSVAVEATRGGVPKLVAPVAEASVDLKNDELALALTLPPAVAGPGMLYLGGGRSNGARRDGGGGAPSLPACCVAPSPPASPASPALWCWKMT
jgi:hypothetical protein